MHTPNEPSTTEALQLANAIVAIPSGEVSRALQRMILGRKLSRTVIALDNLVIDHPEHREIAAKALNKMGLWIAA